MSGPFEALSALDRLIHDPSRLAILTALSACDGADFVFLQSLTGLTNGNLSLHLGRLRDAGLVTTERRLRGRVPQTQVRLTKSGREAIADHWKRLESLRKAADRWGSSHRQRTRLA